jgi:hypothetical protein
MSQHDGTACVKALNATVNRSSNVENRSIEVGQDPVTWFWISISVLPGYGYFFLGQTLNHEWNDLAGFQYFHEERFPILAKMTTLMNIVLHRIV